MWTVIHIAQSRVSAESIKSILTREGILVNLKATGLSNSHGRVHIEVMVPEGEAEEAMEIINEAMFRR